MSAWKHLKTISFHKWLVLKGCCRIGLYRQGLMHDLSKYSWTEFRVGAKYYQGNRSPNTAEREDIGYSTSWMHHKGRNKHHYEYWVDLNPATRSYEPVPMPRKYLAEMVIDRIAASKVYNGKYYTDADSLHYLNRSSEKNLLHPKTLQELTCILTLLAEKGEVETFRFIREVVLTGKEI